MGLERIGDELERIGDGLERIGLWGYGAREDRRWTRENSRWAR